VRFATLSILLLVAFGAQAQAPSDARRPDTTRRERAPLANPDDLEPAVDVGGVRVAIAQRPAPPATPPAAVPPPPAQPTPAVAPSARSAAPPPSPAAVRAEPQQAAPAAPSAQRTATPRALDSIDLGTTSITGNQELPKVLYIVPWKKSDLGDLVGRPVNTLLDEVLAPVDPEVFKRHLEYYETLYGKKGQEE